MANDLSAFTPETWSARMVMKLDQINVALGLVNRNYEGDLRNSKTVWIRTAGNITMAPYVKGTPISYQDLVPTKESFTVSTQSYFAFFVDDIDKAQSDVNAMDVYIKRAVISMNNAIETLILAKMQASVPVANQITGAAGAAITLDSTAADATGIYQQFVKARELRSLQNILPMPGEAWAMVDPKTTSLLLKDTVHFIRASDLGDRVVQRGDVVGTESGDTRPMPGFIGRIAGFNVFENNHLPVIGGSKYLLFGDNDAVTYAGQINELEAFRSQDFFADVMRGLLLHDAFAPAENAKRLVYLKAVP
jgi:hypothetical protein